MTQTDSMMFLSSRAHALIARYMRCNEQRRAMGDPRRPQRSAANQSLEGAHDPHAG